MSVIPMCLGPYMFHATNFGYKDLSRSQSTNWAEMEVVGGFNQAQWTGGQSDKITINGVIFPEEFGGLNTLEALRLAATIPTILPLIALSGKVYGIFRIESIDDNHSYINRYGTPRKNQYTITLTKHIGITSLASSLVSLIFG